MSLLDQASWVMVPSQYKEDTVRAFKPTSTLGDLAFTRSSDATFTDSTGVVRRSPWNLVTFSEMFTDASWAKSRTTISANVTTAPNGTLTADKFIATSASGVHTISQSGFTSQAYSFSVYAKAEEETVISLFLRSASVGATFNLSNGTVSGITVTSATITNVGDGWYRCFVYDSTPGTTINIYGKTGSSYIGNGIDGFYLWGAQLVEGTEALPYFATTDRLNVPRLDYSNADGTLSTCPRLLLEPQRTNSIRNSSMVGAVAGSPGTLPTNWGVYGSVGLSTSVVGVGTENGLPYVDVRINGTATGPAYLLRQESTTTIVASVGQVWTGAAYIKKIAEPAPPLSYRTYISELNAAGTELGGGSLTIIPSTSLQRFAQTRTLANAATERVLFSFFTTLTNGATYDFTIRIAAPQMELGAYATTWVPTTTAAVTRIADVFSRNNIFTNGFITAAGGTWFVDLSNNISFNATGFLRFGIGDTNTLGTNSLILRSTGIGRITINKIIGGASTTLYITLTDTVKIALKWNGTTADVFVNGVKQVSATPFTTTNMQFLSGEVNAPLYMNESWLAPSPLTDSECIALTTL